MTVKSALDADAARDAELWRLSSCGEIDLEECLRELRQQSRLLSNLFHFQASARDERLSDDASLALAEMTRNMAERVAAIESVLPSAVVTWSPHEVSFDDWVINRKVGAR